MTEFQCHSRRTSALQNGSAVQCPNNNCGPRVYSVNGQNVLSSPFQAYGDGTSGYNVRVTDRNGFTVDGVTTWTETRSWRFQAVDTSGSSWNISRQSGRQTNPNSQQQTSLNDDILDFAETLLEKAVNRESCKGFIDKYVGGANLVENFRKLREQGRIMVVSRKSYEPQLALAFGDVESGNAQIRFNSEPVRYPAPTLINLYISMKTFVGTLIHELIHLRAKGGSDTEMGQRLYDAGVYKDPPPNFMDYIPDGDKKKFTPELNLKYSVAASNYWKRQLEDDCRIPEEEFKKWWKN